MPFFNSHCPTAKHSAATDDVPPGPHIVPAPRACAHCEPQRRQHYAVAGLIAQCPLAQMQRAAAEATAALRLRAAALRQRRLQAESLLAEMCLDSQQEARATACPCG